MGCNCKAQEEIGKLLHNYGDIDSRILDKREAFKAKAKVIFEDILIYIAVIPILPFILLFMAKTMFFSKGYGIKISKITRFLK